MCGCADKVLSAYKYNNAEKKYNLSFWAKYKNIGLCVVDVNDAIK
jgi:hypothetical protein